jgi:rubrerythrin
MQGTTRSDRQGEILACSLSTVRSDGAPYPFSEWCVVGCGSWGLLVRFQVDTETNPFIHRRNGGISMNVFETALQNELDVKAHYEKLAGETSLPGIAKIFTLLAEDEQKHYDAIRALMKGADPGPLSSSIALDTARKLLTTFNGDTGTAATLKNDLDGYRHALKIEAESVKFYERLTENEKKSGIKQVLTVILDEEKKHYTIVANLYDFALKPEYFLAWGEFSNLQEL